MCVCVCVCVMYVGMYARMYVCIYVCIYVFLSLSCPSNLQACLHFRFLDCCHFRFRFHSEIKYKGISEY